MEKFSVTLPLSGEYLTTVRLTTGGLCALAGFDVDATEDFKVCVTESLLILRRNGFSNAEILFTVGEALGCKLCGKDLSGEKTEPMEEEISPRCCRRCLGRWNFARTGKDELLKFRLKADYGRTCERAV